MIARTIWPKGILVLLAACLVHGGSDAAAQSPDFIFEGGHYFGTSPDESAHQITSQSNNSGDSGYTETASASASSTTLSLNNGMTVTKSSGNGARTVTGGYRFSIWSKYPGDISLSSAGSATYSISGPNGCRISYGSYVFGSGNFSAVKQYGSITEDGSASQSGSSEVHLGCGGGSTKSFSGVTYYRVAPPRAGYETGSTTLPPGSSKLRRTKRATTPRSITTRTGGSPPFSEGTAVALSSRRLISRTTRRAARST